MLPLPAVLLVFLLGFGLVLTAGAYSQRQARRRLEADPWLRWSIEAGQMSRFHAMEKARLQAKMRSVGATTLKILGGVTAVCMGLGAVLGLRTGQVGQGMLALGAFSGLIGGPVVAVVLLLELKLLRQSLSLRGGAREVMLSPEGLAWRPGGCELLTGSVTAVILTDELLEVHSRATGTSMVNGSPVQQTTYQELRLPVPLERRQEAEQVASRLRGHFGLAGPSPQAKE